MLNHTLNHHNQNPIIIISNSTTPTYTPTPVPVSVSSSTAAVGASGGNLTPTQISKSKMMKTHVWNNNDDDDSGGGVDSFSSSSADNAAVAGFSAVVASGGNPTKTQFMKSKMIKTHMSNNNGDDAGGVDCYSAANAAVDGFSAVVASGENPTPTQFIKSKTMNTHMWNTEENQPQQEVTGINNLFSSAAVAGTATAVAPGGNPTPSQISKSKMMNTHMWNEDQNQQQTHQDNNNNNTGGVDELLAMLGYKVKPSDMDDVALKIEHLDTVFNNDDELSQIVSDSVHYNPSDLNSWLESMICEINPPVIDDAFMAGVVQDSDLQAIAGAAVFPPPAKKAKFNSGPNLTPNLNHHHPNLAPNQVVTPSCSSSSLSFNPNLPPNQVVKPSCSSSSLSYSPSLTPNLDPSLSDDPGLNELIENCPSLSPNLGPSLNRSPSPNQVVIVDSQENGIRLVHTLMACAEAIEAENYHLAENLVKQAGALAVGQAGAMRKVATCFAEALARRIYRLTPQPGPQALTDILYMHFYETCPYLKFAHFTANQAILEAFAGKKSVHVVDFGMKQGMQWPALMQALALRNGGPPKFRLTGIGPPSGDDVDYLQEVGWKLAQLADTINVEFEFRGFVAESLADLDPRMFELRDGEVLAVNSVFELHQLFGRNGGIEKVLTAVKIMKPEIFTVVEQEANHNGGSFLERFTESLHYYSTMFDSIESSVGGDFGDDGGVSVTVQDRIMSEVYLGKQICNVVACEGADRVERHETLTQWKARFDSAGFDSVHLGSNAFKQASMLLALFAGGDGYRVVEEDGCLMLGWHTRPLITTSAWKPRVN